MGLFSEGGSQGSWPLDGFKESELAMRAQCFREHRVPVRASCAGAHRPALLVHLGGWCLLGLALGFLILFNSRTFT